MPSTSLYFSDDLLAAIDKARGHEPRSSFVCRMVAAELAKTFVTDTGQDGQGADDRDSVSQPRAGQR